MFNIICFQCGFWIGQLAEIYWKHGHELMKPCQNKRVELVCYQTQRSFFYKNREGAIGKKLSMSYHYCIKFMQRTIWYGPIMAP